MRKGDPGETKLSKDNTDCLDASDCGRKTVVTVWDAGWEMPTGGRKLAGPPAYGGGGGGRKLAGPPAYGGGGGGGRKLAGPPAYGGGGGGGRKLAKVDLPNSDASNVIAKSA